MEVTIQEKKDNILLNRTELQGVVSFENATISNSKLQELIAKQTQASSELIVIKNIYTIFGKKQAKFAAVIYKNNEHKKLLEPLTKHLKARLEEAKKAEKKGE